MSRGPGYLHRYLFTMIYDADHPLTFAEIVAIAKPHETEYRPHMVRSMRRTLSKMVAGNVLFAEGRGHPGNPYRYSIHPILTALMKIAAKEKASE